MSFTPCLCVLFTCVCTCVFVFTALYVHSLTESIDYFSWPIYMYASFSENENGQYSGSSLK